MGLIRLPYPALTVPSFERSLMSSGCGLGDTTLQKSGSALASCVYFRIRKSDLVRDTFWELNN
jgi:hypothetical protein